MDYSMRESKQSKPVDFQVRNKKIVETSIIGIAANVMLAVLKAIIGTITHSIAITLDAVKNQIKSIHTDMAG